MKRYLALALVLILASGALYFFSRHSSPMVMAPSAATFYCDNNQTVQATFATSSVALMLSDGRMFSLPQAVSASGARYEATTTAGVDTVFWNEGDNAFLTEGAKTTYQDCTAAKVAASDAPGYETYTSQEGTFSFAFPTDFSPAGSAVGYGPNWSAPATTSGQVLAKVVVPQSYEAGTNFGDAWFTVGTSADPSAVATCLDTLAGSQSTSTPITIGNTKFTMLAFSGAGAGNRYDTTSYRTVKGGQCYAIEYTVHYGVLENYPKGAVKEFDEAKVTAALDEVARSFRFLQ